MASRFGDELSDMIPFVGPDLNDELCDRSDHLLVGRNRDVSVYEQLRRR